MLPMNISLHLRNGAALINNKLQLLHGSKPLYSKRKSKLVHTLYIRTLQLKGHI